MAIGWSIGDIIACSQLTYKLIQALRDSDGAKTDYQDLINDLSSIHRTLLEVEQMHHASQLAIATVNAILFEAHSLTKIMDDFLATVEAYHSALSGLSAKCSTNRYRDLVKKLRWSFSETNGVEALRKRLASHSQSIITLIAVATFKAANDPEDTLYDRYHERNIILEDVDSLVVVHKHITRGAGGPDDESTELIEPSYQRPKQPEKFFRVGQVFQMIDSLSEPDPRDATYISYVKSCYIGGHKVRRFVVAQEGTKASICLKIASFAGRGCAHQKHKSDFGIIHTSTQVPNKLPGEEAMTKLPIRVKAAHPSTALHRASRVNYGAVYTVAHSVRVKAVGLVHVDSMLRLIDYYEDEKWETDVQETQPEHEQTDYPQQKPALDEHEQTESPFHSVEKACIEPAVKAPAPEDSESETSSCLLEPLNKLNQEAMNTHSGSQHYEPLPLRIYGRNQSPQRVNRSSSLPPPCR